MGYYDSKKVLIIRGIIGAVEKKGKKRGRNYFTILLNSPLKTTETLYGKQNTTIQKFKNMILINLLTS